MNADVFFCVGKSHSICQDYAESGKDFVVLADGCSSAKDSHIGAVLLTRAMANWMLYKDPAIQVLSSAKYAAEDLHLPDSALYATLGSIQVVGDQFEVSLHGDGVIAARRRRHSAFDRRAWEIISWEYPSGAPYYLAYELDTEARRQYLQKFGNLVKEIHYTQYIAKEQEANWGRLGQTTTWECPPGPLSRQYSRAAYDAIAIMSDGVLSFQKTIANSTSIQTEKVPLLSVLTEVLAFKNYSGQFVQRRCKACFKKFSEEGITHIDDFSIGVVYDEGVCQG